MLKFVAYLALVVAASAVVEHSDFAARDLMYRFETWRREHNFDFEPFEYVQRFRTFSENDQFINEHNSGDSTYEVGHNQFSHLTKMEYRALLGFSGASTTPFRETNNFADVTAADSVDWVAQGAVTPVKNQGQCGSCWAFSTTGGLEGAYQIKNNKLESFSEQELVDCDHDGDQGCNGGLMDHAFGFVKDNGGLCREADYGYIGKKHFFCKSSSCTSVEGSAPTSFTDVEQTQEAMEKAVTQQPISIAIEADQTGFQLYKSGVFTGDCGTTLDHGVLLVGYGTLDETDYWKVKNSWGSSWGLDGYILLERGKAQAGGQCGLLNSASYPTL